MYISLDRVYIPIPQKEIHHWNFFSTIGTKSAQHIQTIIQVDLLWDAFRLTRITIQHGPGFSGFVIAVMGSFNFCATTVGENPAVFQDENGQSVCKACPADTSTLGVGSLLGNLFFGTKCFSGWLGSRWVFFRSANFFPLKKVDLSGPEHATDPTLPFWRLLVIEEVEDLSAFMVLIIWCK